MSRPRLNLFGKSYFLKHVEQIFLLCGPTQSLNEISFDNKRSTPDNRTLCERDGHAVVEVLRTRDQNMMSLCVCQTSKDDDFHQEVALTSESFQTK